MITQEIGIQRFSNYIMKEVRDIKNHIMNHSRIETIQKLSYELEDFVGKYSNDMYGDIIVTLLKREGKKSKKILSKS